MDLLKITYLKSRLRVTEKICILPRLPSYYLKIWLSKVKCYVPFLHKKWFKRKYRQEFLKCMFLPAKLERGTEMLQFDVHVVKLLIKISTMAVTAAQFYVCMDSLLILSIVTPYMTHAESETCWGSENLSSRSETPWVCKISDNVLWPCSCMVS